MFAPRTLTAMILAVAGAGSLAACSVAQQAKVDAFVASASAAIAHDGQLLCAVHAKDGPIIVGLITAGAPIAASALGQPAAGGAIILAMNASKDFVDAACAAAGGIPVSPPPVGTVVPQVSVVVPVVTPAVPAAP